MKKIYLALIVASCINTTMAQTGSVGIGTASPNASAALDVSSINKGMLLPRVTSMQRTAINSPATGLIVFDTDKKLLYFYNGLQWVPLVPGDPLQAAQEIQTAPEAESGEDFGSAVAISGDYAIVGSSGDDAPATNQGSAHIYFRNNGQWTLQAKLTASDGAANDYFGFSVDISGDYAIVGAPQHNDGGINNSGVAYIFRRSGTSWAQVARLSSIGNNQQAGHSVTIDGDYVAIGAPFFSSLGNTLITGCGLVQIWRRVGESWNHAGNIVQVLQEDAHFGSSVSMHESFLIVGTPGEDIGQQTDAGAAYIFSRVITTWSLEERLIAEGFSSTHLYFGRSVDVRNGRAVVGMPRAGTFGRIFIYTRTFNQTASWNEELVSASIILPEGSELGSSVAIEGDYVVAGDPQITIGINIQQGTSLVYKRNVSNGIWYFFRQFSANPAYPYDQMGQSVGIDNQVVISGIPASTFASFHKPRILFNAVE